jgi:hypothetical protein
VLQFIYQNAVAMLRRAIQLSWVVGKAWFWLLSQAREATREGLLLAERLRLVSLGRALWATGISGKLARRG